MTDTQTAASPHPLANAKQRYIQSVDADLDYRMRGFHEFASPSEKIFLMEVFKEWDSAFMGQDLGIASAFETEIRDRPVTIADGTHSHTEPATMLQPDHPTGADVKAQEQEVDALLQQALGMTQQKDAKEVMREFRTDFMSLAAEFFTNSQESDSLFLLRVLQAWEGEKTDRPLAEIALFLALQADLSQFHTGLTEELAALGAIAEAGTWQWDYLSEFLHHWKVGHRITPAYALAILADKYREFTDEVGAAKNLLQHYPQLVKLSKSVEGK